MSRVVARYPGKKIRHVGTQGKKEEEEEEGEIKKKKEKKEERKKFNFPRLVRRIVSISMGGGKNWGYLNLGMAIFYTRRRRNKTEILFGPPIIT